MKKTAGIAVSLFIILSVQPDLYPREKISPVDRYEGDWLDKEDMTAAEDRQKIAEKKDRKDEVSEIPVFDKQDAGIKKKKEPGKEQKKEITAKKRKRTEKESDRDKAFFYQEKNQYQEMIEYRQKKSGTKAPLLYPYYEQDQKIKGK